MRLVLRLLGSNPGLPESVAVPKGEVLRFGRGAHNELCIEHPTVGKHHAVFDFRDEACTVAQDSDISPGAAGIFDNGEKTVTPRRLVSGDTVLVGGIEMKASYQKEANL